jgi:hypothetical protein
VPWIDRAKAILDCGNRQLSIPISQRKKVTTVEHCLKDPGYKSIFLI